MPIYYVGDYTIRPQIYSLTPDGQIDHTPGPDQNTHVVEHNGHVIGTIQPQIIDLEPHGHLVDDNTYIFTPTDDE